MDKASQGIILYSHIPLKKQIIILDRTQGKIESFVRGNNHLLQGALVEYIVHTRNNVRIVSFLEPLALPAPWVNNDIYFLHHVLELCAFYSPAHQAAPDLFLFLSLLYESDKVKENIVFFKKLFLYRLHSLLGLHPDEEVYDHSLLSLISNAGDSMFELHYDSEIESRLTMWLYRSLHAANAHNYLKTFSFVKLLDINYGDT